MSAFDFTEDRYVALLLVSSGKICRIDGTLSHVERRGIDLGVFAALLVLVKEGYVIGQPEHVLNGCQEIRLSTTGSQLLTKFHQDWLARRGGKSYATRKTLAR